MSIPPDPISGPPLHAPCSPNGMPPDVPGSPRSLGGAGQRGEQQGWGGGPDLLPLPSRVVRPPAAVPTGTQHPLDAPNPTGLVSPPGWVVPIPPHG